MLFENPQRAQTVACLQDAVSQRHQSSACVLSDIFVILDRQDCLAFSHHGKLGATWWLFDLYCHGVTGQVHLYCRAVSRFAVDFHMTAGLLDKAIHLTEAEAGALSFGLGGVKRLERP